MKKIKIIHGERPSDLSDEDYQAILDAEEGTFYLTQPEASEVEKLQARARVTKIAEIGEAQYYIVTDRVNELDWLVEQVVEEKEKG